MNNPMRQKWANMRKRCCDPKNPGFASYGGRGIQICERWKLFANFLADMGECPPGMSLDRINNDGNYEPSNCRWATRKQQQRNRSDNHLLTAFGETKTIAEWVEDHRCICRRFCTLATRINVHKWDAERALTQPHKKMLRDGEANEIRLLRENGKSIKELASQFGVGQKCIIKILRQERHASGKRP